MRIVVCVKQVPDTTDVRIDPETNTLVREGVPSAVVSVPSRYIHSPVSTLLISDLEATVKLTVAFLRRAGELL